MGAGISYVKTKTSVNTGHPVSVIYGSGYFNGMTHCDEYHNSFTPSVGTIYTDTVTLGKGLTITKQSIGVANISGGFTGFDGILGIGPVDLTQGTQPKEPTAEILTVTQNLFLQKDISEMVVAVSFEPSKGLHVTNGELTFGGTDSTKYTGHIAYVWVTLLSLRV